MTAGPVIAAAFERIKSWMIAHDAPLLVENLAPGATAAELADTEAELGFSLPSDLRALWALHDGALEEGNGFVESYGLYSRDRAIGEREHMLVLLEYTREHAAEVIGPGLTQAELVSDAWVPFAGLDSDGLAVSAVTGRVFELRHDDWPNLVLVADSIAAWATAYADRVSADDFRVAEGFGDYYLELRDRDAERRQADAAQRMRDRAARHAMMSHRELLSEAIARTDERLGSDVLARAKAESPDALRDTVELLFQTAAPQFVAATLRMHLNQDLTLSAAQWSTVATGGEQLGNNAIRNYALGRLKALGAST